MLSEEDKETLKDGVHVVISGETSSAPFGVALIRLRVVNRGGVASQIANADEAPSVIEETMDHILTLNVPFPQVREAEPDAQGARQWVVLNAG